MIVYNGLGPEKIWAARNDLAVNKPRAGGLPVLGVALKARTPGPGNLPPPPPIGTAYTRVSERFEDYNADRINIVMMY